MGGLGTKTPSMMHPVVDQDCEDIIRRLGSRADRFRGKTILMTGCSGFLGASITQTFLRLNQTILKDSPCTFIGLDNFSRGRAPWLTDAEVDPHMETITHDIVQPLPESLTSQPIHFVIHGASIASPIYYREHPIETMDANVIGLRHLLEFARNKIETLESFLFFSTSEIYGDPDPTHIPTPETYRGFVSCTGPRACYDESKRYGETLCVNFHRVYNVPVKIARPFNNYGPGLKITDRRVLPDFFRDVFENRDITLLSDGTATRTFCYIADATLGYLLLLLSDLNGESCNIGTDDDEISMRDLAHRVADVSGELFKKQSSVVFSKSEDAAYLTDNPNRRCPDITKARTALGYTPVVGLTEGLRRTALWYKDHQTATEN